MRMDEVTDQKNRTGFFLYGVEEAGSMRQPTGIDRKVAAQLKALNEAGLSCRQLVYKQGRAGRWWRRLRPRLPFGCLYPRWRYREELDRADFVYIRRDGMSLDRLRIIRKIRRRNPTAKILYEVPTWPFRKELTSRWWNYPLWWKEAVYMPYLHRYVDRIVIVGRAATIYGIPVIPMVNGIDLDAIRPIVPATEDGAIHIAAVAMFTQWHGYDRFLRGMAAYYASGGKRCIVLHLIGRGPGASELEQLVGRYGLSGRVILHGFLTGAELDAIYDRCHLGLISLATQDKDIHIHSTLKSREYLAKGLPTIATGMTDVFEGTDYRYNLCLSSDAVAVDMDEIAAFYDAVYGGRSREQVIAEIRAFAVRTVDIGITMAPVVRYLKEG